MEPGRVTLLAMTSEKHSPLFSNVPTVSEAGIPGFEISTWWGIVAPAGTSLAIIQTLNQEIQKAASKDPLKGRLLKKKVRKSTKPPQHKYKNSSFKS